MPVGWQERTFGPRRAHGRVARVRALVVTVRMPTALAGSGPRPAATGDYVSEHSSLAGLAAESGRDLEPADPGSGGERRSRL